MKTKLRAAKFVNDNGIDMVLLNGNVPEKIYRVLEGENIGTLFKHKEK
jgi:glutamate 5-kinase